jgi:hypothetical protein
VPTFGRGTIRRFSSNISELKKLAARDFEDILQVRFTFCANGATHPSSYQCAIPVFDGLFPEPHNAAVLELLFVCAHWHAFAKLRMHIDPTLSILDKVTSELGAEFRKFIDKTCPAFDTRELNREAGARKRRQSKKKAANAGGDAVAAEEPMPSKDSAGERRRKTFNLSTYKYHSLGDYVRTIRLFGTTDSYTTELVGN